MVFIVLYIIIPDFHLTNQTKKKTRKKEININLISRMYIQKGKKLNRFSHRYLCILFVFLLKIAQIKKYVYEKKNRK